MSNRKDNKNTQGSYSLEDEYILNNDLTTWSTRELISLLRSQLGRENPDANRMIKEILATREHIPTVKEAKEIRKKKQQEKQNR